MKIWELFQGLDRAYGTYQVTEKAGEKLAGKGKTVQQPVTQDIWDLHLSGERNIGIVPIRDDNTCVFAAIDIDKYPLDHKELEARIKAMGLPLVVCRSKSGGAHLYLFIKPPGSLAENVRPKLAEWAAELGYSGVEIFPKQDEIRNKDDVGNWINMPYFGGDDDQLRYAIVDGKCASMEVFIKEAILKSISHKELNKITIVDESVSLEGGPPCLNTLVRSGFPSGSRNIALFNLGVYCKKRWPDEWDVKIDEMNERYIEPPLSLGEVNQIKRNLEKKAYFYKCSDAPINAVCQKSICLKRPFGIDSDNFGDADFKLEGSIRMLTEEVYYITSINGKRVSLDAHAVVGQHAFRISVMQQTGYMVPSMKPRQFAVMMDTMTKTAQEVEAPKHSGKRGLLFNEVINIASSSNVAESWHQCLAGLPFPDTNGGVFLYPHQLVKHLGRRLSLRSLEPQILMEALLSEGVTISEKTIGGRSFWYLENLQLFVDEKEGATI
jgi:hypothetical protein